MSAIQSDSLAKPDMQAVLSRTHISRDLNGFLLPVFEAISNAMDGIQSRYGSEAALKGEINIRFENPNDPARISITVADNGVGLTTENYNSFKTPFSGYKLSKKGRGFGRFIAFKIFFNVLYRSRYEFFRDEQIRSFRFSITEEKEFLYDDVSPPFDGPGLFVQYNHPLTIWHDLIRALKAHEVMDQIGGHFLPQFLYGWLPRITIGFSDGDAEDITSHFKSSFVEYDTGKFICDIDGDGHELIYSLTKVPRGRLFKNHCLLLSAANRIVGTPRDLTNKIGQPHFSDEADNKYVVIAVVRGEAFEGRLNDARTSIDLPAKSVEAIVNAVSVAIQGKEMAQIEMIKEDQARDLSEVLRENPILRIGLKGKMLDEYVKTKPNNWTAEQFISDLAIERSRVASSLTKQIVAASNNKDEYDSKIKEIVGTLDHGKKEALAEYVIHRKNIISLVDAARRFGDNSRRSPEDKVHELVFRRFSDNVDVSYFEHNLWLIDDALAFTPYISSDRAMHGKGRKSGDKVTDLLFYDDSMVLGDDEAGTLTIVEFKRPSRDDYRFGVAGSDPVLQVIETVKKATAAGGITKTDGSHVSFSGVVRRFAFIVADITPSFANVLQMHDFKNDWNPRLYVRYREREKIFVQAMGYDTLIEMAKKRNQAFFTVLFDE